MFVRVESEFQNIKKEKKKQEWGRQSDTNNFNK